MSDKIFNQFILHGKLLAFEKRISKKNTSWGFGRLQSGNGKYRKYLGFVAFGEMADTLENLVESIGEFKGSISTGTGDRKYEIQLIVNEFNVEIQAVEEDELVPNTEDLPF